MWRQLHHIVYLNEWMYKELMQSSDEDRIVQIYDLSKACLSNLKGDVGQQHRGPTSYTSLWVRVLKLVGW